MTLDPQIIALVVCGLKNHVGRANAITAREIIQKLKSQGHNLNNTTLWEIVRYLRMERGMFICSDGHGYYTPANDEERNHTINSLNSRIREIEDTRDALLKIKSEVKQAELF